MRSFLSQTNKAPLVFAAHLVPTGSPLGLSPFIVFIESVSQVIRPLTLRVRLAANITAGHLILALLESGGGELILGQVSLLFLEGLVAFIQRYVFVMLVYLYFLETYDKVSLFSFSGPKWVAVSFWGGRHCVSVFSFSFFKGGRLWADLLRRSFIFIRMFSLVTRRWA